MSLGLLGGALMLSGNIHAVRAIAVVGAIPFSLIMLIQIVALLKTLAAERRATEEEG